MILARSSRHEIKNTLGKAPKFSLQAPLINSTGTTTSRTENILA